MSTYAPLPTVYATNMIYAQGFDLDADSRRDIAERAAAFRALITDNGGLAPATVSFHLSVRHPLTDELLGQLTYVV